MKYRYTLTETQHEFLRQLVSNPQINVPLIHSKLAGEVVELITQATPIDEGSLDEQLGKALKIV